MIDIDPEDDPTHHDCVAAHWANKAQVEPCKTCKGRGYTDNGDPETGATWLDYLCPDCA